MILRIFFLGLSFSNLSARENEANSLSWTGYKTTMNTGMYGVIQEVFHDDKIRIGPVFELGIEYGYSFGNQDQYYLACDALFNFFYPDSIEKKQITLFGSHDIYPVFIPIFDFLIGYSLDSKNQVLVGSTYFWGVTGIFRHKITDEFFISFKTVWWADRVLFQLGLHDFYATIGAGYHL